MSSNHNYGLRHMFVAMLFALVVGELAIKFYETVDVFYGDRQIISDYDAIMPAITHIFLALIVITTSWIDWSKTFETGVIPRLEKVFSTAYLILLIDVLIVCLYFSLVKSVDKIGDASSTPEIVVLLCIFSLYFIWDILTATEIDTKSKAVLSVVPSFICVLIICIILFIDKYKLLTNWFLLDVLLFGVVLGFRWLKNKQVEFSESLN